MPCRELRFVFPSDGKLLMEGALHAATKAAMKRSLDEIADLLDKPGHLVRRAHQICVAAFETRAAPYNITAPQHVVMTALYKNPEIDQVTLAGIVGLDKVTTGDIVMRLERRRLLRRKRSPHDHRARVLSLTESGCRLLIEMQQIVEDSREEILKNLSAAERANLIRLLRRLIGADAPSRRVKARLRACACDIHHPSD